MRFFLPTIAFVLMSIQTLAADRPNVIFFAVDDLCDWVGAMGHTQAITPNMDALAKSGVMFSNAHAPGTYCAPSRAAIFTGQFASTTGCYGTEIYQFDHPEITPLQSAFNHSGYGTFGGGKLFHHREGYLDHRGWDEFFVRKKLLKQKGWRIESWPMAEDERDVPFPDPFPASIYNRNKKVTGGLFLEWGSIPNNREEDMADTRRVNYACEVLQRKHDKPFFLAVGLYAPHFPNYAPKKYFDLYDPDKIKAPPYKDDDLEDLPAEIRRKKENRRRQHHEKLEKMGAVEDAIHGYLACVSYADAMLGRLLKTLKESPHADNTIVVLWSDHGYHHGEKGDWGKHTLWERTSNVPFIWSGPGIASGAKVDATVSLIDMYPTLVDLCDLKPVKDLEGKSQAKVLAKPTTAKDRDVYLPYLDPGGYAIINEQWRYIHYSNQTEELYNIKRDPNEWHNLANDPNLADVKKKLKASAPKTFAKPGTPKNQLQLVIEGETFHWKLKSQRPAKKRPNAGPPSKPNPKLKPTKPGVNQESPPATPWHFSKPERELVLAYYYPWYIKGDWSRHGYVGTPKLGKYGTDDPKVCEQHIRWGKQAGLDGLVVSWWGPDHLTDKHFRSGYLKAKNVKQLKFAFIYECLGRLDAQDGERNSRIDFSKPGVLARWVADFQYLKDTYFSHPSYLKVGKRPVVVLYVSRTFRNFDASHIASLEKQVGVDLYLIADEPFIGRQKRPETAENSLRDGQSLFDAYTAYNMFENANIRKGETALAFMRREAMPIYRAWAEKTVFCPGILPRYHDFRGNKPLVGTPAQYVNMIREMRGLPLRPVSKTVDRIYLITSFNEWWEGSTIEPATEYGTTFLNATRKGFDR